LKSSSHRSKRKRVPARARRFSPAQHAHALSLILDGIEREQVAKTIGCTTESLRRWYAEGKKQGLVTKLGKGEGTPVAAKAAATKPTVVETAAKSTPHDPGAGLGEHEVKAILDYKKKHPSMGPAQIRAQLKRFLGWRVSVKAIARVLRKAGYAPVHRKGRPVGDEHPRRFEAPHRNALWQLDFTELRVGSERRWLLVIEDDFSRFVVGHVLAEGPTSEVVVAAMREAIRLHGKPERVYTDRGAAFTAWRDVTSCEQFLDEQLIDHSLRKAHRPQGGGKIESVIGTVQRELWEVVHFDDVAEAERALAAFFADYKYVSQCFTSVCGWNCKIELTRLRSCGSHLAVDTLLEPLTESWSVDVCAPKNPRRIVEWVHRVDLAVLGNSAEGLRRHAEACCRLGQIHPSCSLLPL
jgi:transposase InsO family protein